MSEGALRWRDRALVAERQGDASQALALMDAGLRAFPQVAPLHNSAGSLALRLGLPDKAEAAFAAACALAPEEAEYIVNRAIALEQAGQAATALAVLKDVAQPLHDARYWSVRGACYRSMGDLAEAARCYDRALAMEPQRALALKARARVALEQGDASADARFRAALTILPNDRELWLGRAYALAEQGEQQAAFDIAESIVRQAPGWLDGLRLLAELRLARGEADFSGHFHEASRQVPHDPAIRQAHIALLESVERYADAHVVAVDAARQFPGQPDFAVAAAAMASAAGELALASTLFAQCHEGSARHTIERGRHMLRLNEPAQAARLLEPLRHAPLAAHAAYALLGIAWRLTHDERASWLHEQDGLVRLLPLHNGHAVLPPALAVLDRLHDRSAFPLGQSLRGGTQTRHRLFDRAEPEFAALKGAILATLEEYRVGLPPEDCTHPMLSYRAQPWKMAGSWSVRLCGGTDYHASHIHPQGLLSSALYLMLPDTAGCETKQGWLELGRPPRDLGLELGPLATLQPREGYLALFPSTLYHGTTPFQQGRRMTVAFDIVARD